MIRNIIFDLGNVVIPTSNKLGIVKQFFKDEKEGRYYIRFNTHIASNNEFWRYSITIFLLFQYPYSE